MLIITTYSTSILRLYICVCVCTRGITLLWMYWFKRNQLKIVNDHLNTRVLSISLISQQVISMSFYPISKGSCTSIILQTSKVICVIFSTYRKFFFLKMSDYPISSSSSSSSSFIFFIYFLFIFFWGTSYFFVIKFYTYIFSDYFN